MYWVLYSLQCHHRQLRHAFVRCNDFRKVLFIGLNRGVSARNNERLPKARLSQAKPNAEDDHPNQQHAKRGLAYPFSPCRTRWRGVTHFSHNLRIIAEIIQKLDFGCRALALMWITYTRLAEEAYRIGWVLCPASKLTIACTFADIDYSDTTEECLRVVPKAGR